jgi:hypothetical protein
MGKSLTFRRNIFLSFILLLSCRGNQHFLPGQPRSATCVRNDPRWDQRARTDDAVYNSRPDGSMRIGGQHVRQPLVAHPHARIADGHHQPAVLRAGLEVQPTRGVGDALHDLGRVADPEEDFASAEN